MHPQLCIHLRESNLIYRSSTADQTQTIRKNADHKTIFQNQWAERKIGDRPVAHYHICHHSMRTFDNKHTP